ncbi:MAG: CBS domain-containing protein [Anaerolineae bacterium]|nr:CBS domain-containing protein [Anaerolineae bacterium]
MKLILTHNNADFDAVASMLAAHKLTPDAVAVLPPRQLQSVTHFLTLYHSALPFIQIDEMSARNTIEHVTLTDAQTVPDVYGIPDEVPTLIIEHHELERKLRPHETWAGEDTGAATTLLVEQMQQRHITLTALEATLMMLGIYADTGMMTYGNTTSRDISAAAWLLDQGASLDTVRKFMMTPLGDDQQRLLERLLATQEHYQIVGYDIVISTATADKMISEINAVATQLRDMLDAAALFVLVELPSHTQLVARSRHDNIDVGQVAQLLGGGGHTRAAAAAIYNKSLADIKQTIRENLLETVAPAKRIREIMSQGAQSVQVDEAISSLLPRLRRIGHEGYPVLADGNVVGLLTLRDANRAIEHELADVRVHDVMQAGNYSLRPDDSVSDLEQIMVKSGWGQIPVVDDSKLLGIVTRTDLIQYWAQTHPQMPKVVQPIVSADGVQQILGISILKVIETIGSQAQQQKLRVYIVGGIVRDLLLKRANIDIDFVIEGDAIQFAEHMQLAFGGEIYSYRPFGTAKWHFSQDTADALGVSLSDLPHHVDFASARNEYYVHPTALPTVYSANIKLDLTRRDFTINTLALQISPASQMWQIVDYFSGMDDLEKKLIRVLHSLSFVDDPTRILRAVRFAHRLQFTIEPRTRELIDIALPMLRRITGERVRNEISLLLAEKSPEYGIRQLQRMGILKAIHTGFEAPEHLIGLYKRVREYIAEPLWHDAYWHVLLSHLAEDQIRAIGERLLFGQPFIEGVVATHRLCYHMPQLSEPSPKVSEIVALLDGVPELSLEMANVLMSEPAIEHIKQYRQTWQHIKPIANGNTLKSLGLEPGPQYREILSALRNAWLDGDVTDDAEEQVLLEKLVKEAQRHGTE